MRVAAGLRAAAEWADVEVDASLRILFPALATSSII